MPARLLLVDHRVIRRLSTPARYVAATAVVFAIVALRWWFGAYLVPVPFLLFFPGVVLVALYLNRNSSYYASVLSVLCAQYFFLPPYLSFRVDDPSHILALFLFLLVLLFTSWLVERLRAVSLQLDRERDEKAMLLQEVNHRTKNNIQLLSSVLLMQAGRITDPAAKAAFHDAVARVSVVGRLHQRLYGSGRADVVDTKAFVEDLCESLQASFLGERPVAVRVRADSWELAMERAVALALIINELVTNSLKHAFPDGRAGVIDVVLERWDGVVRLTVADDGIGYVPRPGRGGLGSQFVPLLAHQLGGEVEVAPRDGCGTRTVVMFPLDAAAAPL